MNRIFFFFLFLFIFLTGCKDGKFLPERTEVDKLNFVRAMALDKGSIPNTIKVTITSKEEKFDAGEGNESGSGGGHSKIIVATSEAETVFTAVRSFQSSTDKRLSFGHTDFILIGEDMAKEDISGYFDFITRDHEIRLTSLVYLVRGEASDILYMSNSSQNFLPDRLKNLSDSVELLSISSKMEIYQFEAQFDKNNIYAIAVPSLEAIEKKYISPNSDKEPSKDININGYGIIKNYKLIGFINNSMARAYNFIVNEVGSGAIDIKNKDDRLVSMEIIGSETEIIPKIEENELAGIIIKTKFYTNINEAQVRTDILAKENINFLKQQQTNKINEEMKSLLKYAKENKADFLKIGQKIMLKHPVIWDKIKNQWDEVFSTLDIDIEIESIIMRTYDLEDPGRYKEDEKY